MNEQLTVLDHGYIRLIETWGSGDANVPEAGIIEAARMSTDKAFVGWPADERLLAYLYNHKHMTPFEMAGMIIEVKAPIFVFREWHRHRTQSFNEMSARYIPIPDEHFLPEYEDLLARAYSAATSTNKQERSLGADLIRDHNLHLWINLMRDFYKKSEELYRMGLEVGVPKELARLPMAVGRYSKMRASANLRNWLAFLTLRMDLAAQLEIRQYANAVGKLVSENFPRTWELFFGGGDGGE